MPDPLVNVDPKKTGALASMLLCREASWVRRRKLRIDFIDDVAMRLRQSVDFCVPDGVKPIGRTGISRKYAHLPLFVLRKAPQELIDFDLVDARNISLSLPTRAANAELSRQTLLARAKTVLEAKAHPSQIPQDLEELIALVATEEPSASLDACDQLLRATRPHLGSTPSAPQNVLANDNGFRFLARLVSWSSIVALPIELTPGQKLVKLAYSEPIIEWTRDRMLVVRAGVNPIPAQIDLPYVGAQTFHLETHPPQGMAVSAGTLAVRTARRPKFRTAPKAGRALHLYMPDVAEAQSGAAFIELGARRPGFIENAWSACGAVTGMLALSIVFADPLARANKTVPTLLLFLPGLLATLALQPTAHALTRQVLTVFRYAIMLCAALAFLAAFWLIAAPEEVKTTTAEPASILVQRRTALNSGLKPEGQSPSQLQGRQAVQSEIPAAEAGLIERPSIFWLRAVWSGLFVISLAATGLVWVARARAQP